MSAVEEPVVPPVPITRPEPQDHLRPAAEREAKGEELATIEFEGTTFTFAADSNKLPVRALRAIEDGAVFKFLEHIVTPGEFENLLRKYKREHGHEATGADFEPLMEAAAVALGFKTAGE